MSKKSFGQKGEKTVIAELEKIKEYHHLLNDVTLINQKSDMSHQIDHILIHPHGIFVIETKNYFGDIIFDKSTKQWWKINKGKRDRINNPLLQNKSHAISLYRSLKSEYKPISVVVFVQNNAPYFPDDNVINLNDLLLFIESYPYEHKYTKNTLDKIKGLIEKRRSDVSLNEHLENISYLKQIRKEQQAEMTYAIENRKCPWCDSQIIVVNKEYRCSRCKFKFTLY